jgi:hypothetical protein
MTDKTTAQPDLAHDAIDALQRANNGLLLDARSQFMARGQRDAALLVDDARHKVSQAMQDLKRALNHG